MAERRAKKPCVTKIDQICDYVRKNPDVASSEVIAEFNCHSSQVSTARKRVRAEQGNGSADMMVLDSLQKDVRIIKKMGVDRARTVISLIESIQGG